MVKLEIGINPVFVTLFERMTLSNPDILVNLVFRDETSKNKIIKTLDSSVSTDRVNELTIEVVTTEGAEDLDNAKVYLDSGFYSYQMYESNDGTRDITGKNLLETGILIFNLDENITQYVETTNESIYKG